MLDILASAHELCSRHGIDLVVAFVPAKFRVYREACAFSADSPCLEWKLDELGPELRRALQRRVPDIGYIDLTPRFLSAALTGLILYLPDDTHWSRAGHRLAAEILGDGLRDRQLLKQRNQVEHKTEPLLNF
jgi:hypothetical protein